jgi:phytoene dehydrogenase-like protein
MLRTFQFSKATSRLCGRSIIRAWKATSCAGPNLVFPFDEKTSQSRAGSAGDWIKPDLELRGSCECGAVGYIASGPSSLNFVCHCAHCREHSRQPYTQASAFLPRQIKWVNPQLIKRTEAPPSGDPSGPKSFRCHCSACNGYIGDDAPRSMGVVKLPLAAANNYSNIMVKQGFAPVAVQEVYLPNHHIFYGERVADINDHLPKWESFPEGIRISSSSDSAAVDMKMQYQSGSQDGIKKVDMKQYNDVHGRYRKDVMPMSATRAPIPEEYWYTEHDAPVNHITEIKQAKMDERRKRKYVQSNTQVNFAKLAHKKYGAIVIGGGHNALVAAAYLAKQVKDVLVLERRPLVGGAAVTEEMIPGFKFSRGSYLAGLLRPKVIEELDLFKHGIKYLVRDPSSFTPSLVNGPNAGKYLLLGSDDQKNWDSIAQFDKRDADAYPKYEEFLYKVRNVVQPILDHAPMNLLDSNNTLNDTIRHLQGVKELVKVGYRNREVLMPFYELFTGPASHILDRWFESEMLKTTLATDAVIGANISPKHNGSAYVLLHHVMGDVAGRPGVWAYVEGGMGAVSDAIARSALSAGATIECNASVKRILYNSNQATGVELEDGTKLESDYILSGTTPYHTFLELLPGLDGSLRNSNQNPLPKEFVNHIRFADYSCQCFKINMAVDRLPNFECYPSSSDGKPGPQHFGTTHFENTMEEIENAYRESSMGMPATRPVIEMTIPSSLDRTISPEGKHVVQLFVQYAPYDVDPKIGHWADPAFKEDFVYRCLRIVDEFCPGFSSSIIGYDALSPLDLERVFGLHKGSIHHGALSLHQLGVARPMPGWSNYRTPMKGLYLVGAGTHPGGGVMGAAGRNGAAVVLGDMQMNRRK